MPLVPTSKIVIFAKISVLGHAVWTKIITIIMAIRMITHMITGMIIHMTTAIRMITIMITGITIIPIRMPNIRMALNQSDSISRLKKTDVT